MQAIEHITIYSELASGTRDSYGAGNICDDTGRLRVEGETVINQR